MNTLYGSVLLVDSGAGDCAPANGAYYLHVARSTDEVVQRLSMESNTALVLVNMRHSPQGGLEVLQHVRRLQPSVPVVMLASTADPQDVVRAVRMGADDCVSTPADSDALRALIEAKLKHSATADSDEDTESHTDHVQDDRVFIAVSPEMQRLREQIRQLSKVDVPVLCLGESGTGKEVVARLIHQWSPRVNRVFFKVNCAALPSELLESELFGYDRGAFTGAERSKPGKFELSNNGTIFLDEIGEMPSSLQAKLLHVLQDQEFTRLGGRLKIKVNVRVIAATNVDIEKAISAKTFREDVYYRLSTFIFRIPPLRERRDDVPLLLRRYLKHYAALHHLPERRITPEVLERCHRYEWPGNVRELENFARRYLILGDPEPSRRSETENNEAFGTARAAGPNNGDLKTQLRGLKEEAESVAIRDALEKTNWNRKAAAELLNISYKSLLGKIRQHGLASVNGKALNIAKDAPVVPPPDKLAAVAGG